MGFLGAFGSAIGKAGSAIKKNASNLPIKKRVVNSAVGGLQSLGGQPQNLPFKRSSSPAKAGENERGLFKFGRRKKKPAEMED